MKKLFFLSIFVFGFQSVYAQQVIDHRKFQTPVTSQGYRGTCTAFGVAAALEILPGVPANISEQYLYGALKHSQPGVAYSEGDYLHKYITSLQEYGFIHEEELPYNENSLPWKESDDEFVRMIQGSQIGAVELLELKYYAKYTIQEGQYAYYTGSDVSNPEFIKNLLRNGYKAVAIAYNQVHGRNWSKEPFSAEQPIEPTITVSFNGKSYSSYRLARLQYTDGNLMDDIKLGKVEFFYNDRTFFNPQTREIESNYGGHVVTIVGYNEKGFIFKNSWDTTWGDEGYGYISYDAHKLMATEALVFHDVTFVKPKGFYNVTNQTDIRLKFTSLNKNNSSKYQLSIFTKDILSDPRIISVKYKIYNQNGQLIEELTRLGSVLDANYDNTFSVSIFENQVTPLNFILGNSAISVLLEISSGSNTHYRSYYNVFNKTDEYTSGSL